jgi:hypothetical protein
MISNGERFKVAFAERDKKQTMIEESQKTGFKTSFFPPQGLQAFCRLRALIELISDLSGKPVFIIGDMGVCMHY